MGLAGLSLLLAGWVHASGKGESTDANATLEQAGTTPATAPCVDLNTGCSTLMVNYFGDSVVFAQFRGASAAQSAGGAVATGELSGYGAPTSGDDARQLGIDFLRGFSVVGDDAGLHSGASTSANGQAQPGDKHDWTYAAATVMAHRVQRAAVDRGNDGTDGDNAAAMFWDLRQVYQWEVDESVLDSGKDLSQVALSHIYLAHKRPSTSDPKIVVCEVNDPNNCRPLTD